MNIINLKIENFKRIAAVEITPDQKVIMITGKNTHGKTSVLDAIWAALSNPRFSEIPKPVKEGEEKAIITVELDQYIVTRTFTEIDGVKKTTLKVEGGEGAIFQSPQKLLDKLLGSLTFDPLAFIDMKGKDQVEMLLQLAGGEIDIEAMDAARESAYTQRTAANQSVKTLSAARGEEPAKVSRVDLSLIQGQMEKSSKLRRDIEEQTKRVENIREQITKLKSIEKEIDDYLVEAKETEAKYKPYFVLKAELDKGIENNQNVGAWEKWNEAGESIKVYSDKSNEYTNKINEIDDKKEAAIAALEFPYPGLSFGEGGVVFNNIPLKQASKAEQIRISMAIAMAFNPKLRVLRVEDGSLLDSENLKLIHDLAEEHDYQVWVESCEEGGKVGIFIEDGQIKANNYEDA